MCQFLTRKAPEVCQKPHSLNASVDALNSIRRSRETRREEVEF